MISKFKKLLVLLGCICVFGCVANANTTRVNNYDREIKTFKIETPLKKVAVGVLYFVDARNEMERLGEDFLPQKRSLRLSVTKLTEEMLLKSDGFSSVNILTSFDIPDVNDAKAWNEFKRINELDYIFAGEILEAKILKVDKKSSAPFAVGVYLNKGILPEMYEYIARVRLKGKLVSVADAKVVWEGGGTSNFKQGKRYSKRENVIIGAMHNAIGEMLSLMSKNFHPMVKEIQ